MCVWCWLVPWVFAWRGVYGMIMFAGTILTDHARQRREGVRVIFVPVPCYCLPHPRFQVAVARFLKAAPIRPVSHRLLVTKIEGLVKGKIETWESTSYACARQHNPRAASVRTRTLLRHRPRQCSSVTDRTQGAQAPSAYSLSASGLGEHLSSSLVVQMQVKSY